MFLFLWVLLSTQLFLCLLLFTPTIVDAHSHQNKDSLRNALEVLTRKQRSLDVSSQQPQNYYNTLRTIKYSDEPIGNNDDDDDDDNDDEEELDFLSMNNPDEFNDINDNNLQRINDIKYIMDSLRNLNNRIKTETSPHDNEQSLFRERERIGNYKRDTEHSNSKNSDHDELAQLFLDALHDSYSDNDFDNIDEYSGLHLVPANDLSVEMLQPSIYDKYKNNPRDRINIDDSGRSLTEFLLPNSRTISMERYPISREYKNSIKRFAIAKRSGNIKKLNEIKSQENTDPKVAQDLKSLFGTRTMAEENLTAPPINHDHNAHKMEHTRDQINMESMKRIESTTEFPVADSTISNNNGQHEIEPTIISSLNDSEDKLKLNKNKIKKSVDWSQYFGIDRRRKKTELLAQPGTQDQDDEWLLQQYYKTIAENLRKNHLSTLNNENKTRSDGDGSGGGGGGGNGNEKRDKLDQMDERLKNVKNLIMKDAAKYCQNMSENDPEANSQEVKDVIMARLAAAYSLEKMRRALNNFKNSIALERPVTPSQKSLKYNNNNSNIKEVNQDKRSNINNNDVRHPAGYHYDGMDFDSFAECPELNRIETSCKPMQRHTSYSLFIPCVMYKICRLCDDKRMCATELLLEASRICDNNFDGVNSIEHQKQCSQHALMILQMRPPRLITETSICYDGTLINSCLRRYQQSNRPMRHNINDIVNENLD